jgi:hypothetical protein
MGATGATGAAGSPGGAGEVWVLDQDGTSNAFELPAGSYTIAGTVSFYAAPAPECTVWRGVVGGGASGFNFTGVAANGAYTLPVGGTFTLSSPTDVWAECTDGGVYGIAPNIFFTRVGTIHAQ